MRRRFLILGSLFTMLLPAGASADWLISPYVGVRFATETRLFDPEGGAEKQKFAWGISTALLSDGILGVEADFGYIPGFFEAVTSASTIASSRAISLMGNVIIATPLSVSSYGLRPYVVGGVGWLHARSVDPNGFFSVNENMLGMNIGGGAMGPLTPRSSIRFEVRQFRNLGDDEPTPLANMSSKTKLSFWRATVGITFRY